MKKKSKGQKQHSQKRAVQRYGITLGDKSYKQICLLIQDNQSRDRIFLEKQSNRVSMWAVKIDNQWLPVIYDKIRHTIVTFLPPEALNPYHEKINGS